MQNWSCKRFFFNFKKFSLLSKLRWLGLPNWFVDDSKLDSNKFGRRLYNNSNFKVKIGLWSQNPNKINGIKRSIKMTLISIKRSKWSYLTEKDKTLSKNQKINLFWPFFDQILIKSTGFWTSQLKLDLLKLISSQRLGSGWQIQIENVNLKLIGSQFKRKFQIKLIQSPKLTSE